MPMSEETFYQLLEDKNIRPAELARKMDLNRSSITIWARNRIPAERVLEVERITGIPRTRLRPDIYPEGHK